MNFEHTLRSLNPDIFYEIIQSEISHFFSSSGSLQKKIKRTHRFPEQTRQYQAGDPVRFIDWRQFARTDQLTVNLVAENSPAVVHIVIYVSESMLWPPTTLNLFKTDIQKIELAERLAFCLAFLHTKNFDDVCITFCAAQKTRVFKFKTPSQVLEQFKIFELDQFVLRFDDWIEGSKFSERGDVLYIVSDFLPQSLTFQDIEYYKNFNRALLMQTLHSKELDISWLKDDVCAIDGEPATKNPLGKELHAHRFYNRELDQWIIQLKKQFSSDDVEFASLHDAMAVEDWLHILHEFTG